MQIRPAAISDLDALLQLEQAAFSGDRLSRRQLRHHLMTPGRWLLLALEGGDLLGYALLLRRERSSVGRIYSIAVAAAARGRGVGAALMRALAERASQAGLRELRLEVRDDNTAAQQLYRRLGYQRFGRRERYYDDGMDAQRWRLPLSSDPDSAPAAPPLRD